MHFTTAANSAVNEQSINPIMSAPPQNTDEEKECVAYDLLVPEPCLSCTLPAHFTCFECGARCCAPCRYRGWNRCDCVWVTYCRDCYYADYELYGWYGNYQAAGGEKRTPPVQNVPADWTRRGPDWA